MKITLTTPDNQKHVIPQDAQFFTIGRKKKNLTITSKQISRDHAEICINNLGAHIKDNENMFGTAVNEKEIPQGDYTTLKNGDKITFACNDQPYEILVTIEDDTTVETNETASDEEPIEVVEEEPPELADGEPAESDPIEEEFLEDLNKIDEENEGKKQQQQKQ